MPLSLVKNSIRFCPSRSFLTLSDFSLFFFFSSVNISASFLCIHPYILRMLFTFREFLERKDHDDKQKPADIIGSLWQELGIDRDSLPDSISTGYLELPEQGLYFNQCVWQ